MAYPLMLFLHIVAALALFVGLGLEWTAMHQLRQAGTGREAIEALRPLASLRRVYPASMVTILVSGLYLTATRWGHVWWAVFGLVGMILIFATGRGLAGGRMRAIREAVIDRSGPLSSELRHQLRDPLVWASIQVRVGLALGIVFLMSVKPGPIGSLATLAVALVTGISASMPVMNRRPEGDPAT